MTLSFIYMHSDGHNIMQHPTQLLSIDMVLPIESPSGINNILSGINIFHNNITMLSHLLTHTYTNQLHVILLE